MALETGCRELRCFMIRIGRASVIGQVTIDTLRRRPLEHAANVTLLTGRLDMLTRQRERSRIVIKRGLPIICRMALETGRRELGSFVIGIGRAIVIGKVTVDTLRRRPLEHTADVTLLTGRLHVLTG